MLFKGVAFLSIFWLVSGDYTVHIHLRKFDNEDDNLLDGKPCDIRAWWCQDDNDPWDCGKCDISFKICVEPVNRPVDICSCSTNWFYTGNASLNNDHVTFNSTKDMEHIYFHHHQDFQGVIVKLMALDMDVRSPNDIIDFLVLNVTSLGLTPIARNHSRPMEHSAPTYWEFDIETTCLTGSAPDCKSPFTPCLKNICLNGGTCVPKDDGPKCACPNGFAGDICEIDQWCEPTLNFCWNGGICLHGSTPSCKCQPWASGPRCATTACGAHIHLTAPGVQVSSPSWPDNLVNHGLCSWTLEADPGARVQLDLTRVKFGPSTATCVDSGLSVFDGDASGTPLKQICPGSQMVDHLVSTQTKMTLVWWSNQLGNGFQANAKPIN